MAYLVIETALSLGLLLIGEKEKVITFESFEANQNLSKNIHLFIENLLKKNQIDIRKIEFIGCGIGPGCSYTGTRIALVTAKSFAFGLQIPAIGFLSPFAFLPDLEGNFTYILDAKMGEYYLIKGKCTHDQIDHIDRFLIDRKKLEEVIRKEDQIITDIPSIKEKFPSCIEPRPNPHFLAKLVYKKFLNRSFSEIEPVYFR
ncbi:MAG: tRNA (adenosine(37)-N6)-threonylcarbamoyltransferase complex dimerization subunit type 1 TsaB [Chlamydiae bacterium]|nr:tRNA (adenosine(37)-N6)-threonylcarbamoyltransferase complex dimerization subunit type 1 TsaB [Chlamydiota bacterium]